MTEGKEEVIMDPALHEGGPAACAFIKKNSKITTNATIVLKTDLGDFALILQFLNVRRVERRKQIASKKSVDSFLILRVMYVVVTLTSVHHQAPVETSSVQYLRSGNNNKILKLKIRVRDRPLTIVASKAGSKYLSSVFFYCIFEVLIFNLLRIDFHYHNFLHLN